MIKVEGSFFKDTVGRVRILRGVNLGGSSKVPMHPNGATHLSEHFFDYKGVSFIGRPFPLEEADEHFLRLKRLGMRFLRFLVTWEAIEHEAPGVYDQDYLDYVVAILQKAHEYDLLCFIDPHQDVWSRWTGGDGAPAWTLEKVGLNLENLHRTGASLTHQSVGADFPPMIWPSNYTKLATATMFTLFFGGNDFAPKTLIDGIPAQEYLQSHFINAIKQVAIRVKDLPNVVGFDSLNEPSGGFIGHHLEVLGERMITAGATPTAFQAIQAGAGYAVTVNSWEMNFAGARLIGEEVLNPEKVRVWQEGFECIWQQNGVWTDVDNEPTLLNPKHFLDDNGNPPDIANDYMKPFMIRYISEIRSVMPHAILFIEGVPGGQHPEWTANDPDNAANASHWYDVMTLYQKQFSRDKTFDWGTKRVVDGAENVQGAFNSQLHHQKLFALQAMNGIPTLIGEFGLPFDLNDKQAYQTSDFREHVEALTMYYDAMDANLLSCTLWNYTADNTNAHGDGWNGEDLSIFSRNQQTDENDILSGVRALEGLVRPYPLAIAGEPIAFAYNSHLREFTLTYQVDARITAPTVIFVPKAIYRTGYTIVAPEGTRIERDDDNETVSVYSPFEGNVNITIEAE